MRLRIAELLRWVADHLAPPPKRKRGRPRKRVDAVPAPLFARLSNCLAEYPQYVMRADDH